jgi:RimJ/RimL family protein N-acetyltransferase
MIHTDRLILRRFRPGDAADLYEYLSDPTAYRFEPGEPVTFEGAQRLVQQRSEGEGYWAAELKGVERVIGHVYLAQIEPAEVMTWELGYIFNPLIQRRGYATEATIALVRYAFVELEAHRIVAHCNPENTASWRVLQKAGFTLEGRLRQNVFFRRDSQGRPLWTDTLEYAILFSD